MYHFHDEQNVQNGAYGIVGIVRVPDVVESND